MPNTLNILTLIDFYLPGFKGGGSTRTLANMIDHLGEEFNFKILTRDRDLQDENAYSDIQPDQWQTVGKAKVCYLSKPKSIFHWLKNLRPDLLYLNSFFSFWFSIFPLLLHKFYFKYSYPVLLAPRGEFSKGALKIKSLKKQLFILFMKASGIYRNIVWHASSVYEEADIKRIFGDNIRVNIALDAPSDFKLMSSDFLDKKTQKSPGSLRIVFLSRISPMKNLKGALSMLSNLTGKIQFDIYGPLEDESYWIECQKLIAKMPANITVRYCGAVKHDQVISIMEQYHLFFFPTHGENFGHVILEALLAGCPVLLSDQTPWLNLETENVGASFSLSEPHRFQAFIQNYVDMDADTHDLQRKKAYEYGLKHMHSKEVVKQNYNLFINFEKALN